jgi:drug/metabolite transporter (DMT)-like permease
VLFAVVLGVWLLKEKLKLRQWLAALAILSGLIFLRI